jgi:hypothetical protein
MWNSLRHAAVAAPVILGINGPGVRVCVRSDVLTITVRIEDQAAVSDWVLMSAKSVAARIFMTIDVKVTWAGPPANTRESRAARDPQPEPNARTTFRIIMVPQEVAERVHADPKAFGIAAGNARESSDVAYVFYDRVLNVAARFEQRRGAILGHVIAHELGHLLLPYGSHSESGLMRMDWSRADLEHAAHGLLLFTSQEAALIRERLLAHPGRDDPELVS